MEIDSKNSEVVRPIINGKELNNNPDQSPGRSVINFRDWPIEKAQQFTAPYSIVEARVRSERENQKDAGSKTYWWRFLRPRPEMSDKIKLLKRCFVTSRVTKYLNFSSAPTDIVFTNNIFVLTSDRWDHCAVAQSTIHEVWARKYSMSLKQDLQFSPSNCFETFSFPDGQWQHPNPDLAAIGERYHEHRRDLMLRLWLGLTDIYNLFHAPDLEARLATLHAKRAKSADWRNEVPAEHRPLAGSLTPAQAHAAILELRALHRALDQAVLTAYAWHEPGPDGPAIELGHDFQQVETLPENDRTRYTITPQARKDLLTRLLKLNHARAAEEAAQAPVKANKTGKPQRAKKEDEML